MMKVFASFMALALISLGTNAKAVTISSVAEATGYDGDGATFAADGTIDTIVNSPTRLEWHLLDQTNPAFPQTSKSVIEFPLAGLSNEEFVTLSLKTAGFTGGSSLRVHGYSGNGTIEASDFIVNNPLLPEFDDNVITLPDYGTVIRTIDVTDFIHNLQLSNATHAGFMLLSENPAVGTNGGTEVFGSASVANPLLAPSLRAGNGQNVIFSTGFGDPNDGSNNISDWGFTFQTSSGNGIVEVIDDPLQADNRVMRAFDPTGDVVSARALLPVAELGDLVDLTFSYAFLTPGKLEVKFGGNTLTTDVNLVGGDTEFSIFSQPINILQLLTLDTINQDGVDYVELILEFSNLTQADQALYGFSNDLLAVDPGVWLLDEFDALSNAEIAPIPEPNAGLLCLLGLLVLVKKRNKYAR